MIMTDNDNSATAQKWEEVTPEELEELRQIAQEHGVSLEVDEEEGFVDPATLTVLLLGASLAVATVAYLFDQRRGGQVIDLRPGADPIARRDRGLIYGLILLVAVDGKVEVSVEEPKGMFGQVIEALKAVLGDLLGATAKEAKELASPVVQGKANLPG